MWIARLSWLALTLATAYAADAPSKIASAKLRSVLSEAERLKTDDRIAFLEKAGKDDPSPFMKTALAAAFIQKMRETGDGGYLQRASQIVNTILDTDPSFLQAKRLRNEIEMNLHRFAKVADYAETMLANDPSDASTWGLLGDAQMELGRYDRAGEMYKRMVTLGANLFSYNRLAYHEFVTGHPDTALAWMAQAIEAGSRAPENLAWCYSDMGDMLFKVGRVPDAEYVYRHSLQTFPGYHRAYAGIGRVLASRGEFGPAIANFLKAQSVVPLAEYAGALETLYQLSGDASGASKQRALLETVAKLMAVNGEKANRTLALIYADQDRNLMRASELAQAEFEVRNDVYSYDALSWVLYKQKKFPEALAASRKATALDTPEPSFYFHAGMIALANADAATAQADLAKALKLNPNFDPRNAPAAKTALAKLAPGHSALPVR